LPLPPRKLGLDFPASYHLINTIDIDGPFGEPCDAIANQYKGKDWLTYLGADLQLDKLDETIELVEHALGNYSTCFMHGTTASVLQKIYDKDGTLNISRENTGTHDFGDGLYCFRGHFESFAVDRSWPLEFGEDVSSSNAAVIIFPDGPREIDGFLDKSEHILTDIDLKEKMGERCFAKLQTNMNEWSDTDTNWKRFVKAARKRVLPYFDYLAYDGLLHDCDTVAETDDCNEPVPDRNRWTQFCFPYPNATLGTTRLFVEFFIDWDKWIVDGASREDVDRAVSGT